MFATVSDKGQVTLPKAIRDRLGIRPGTKLAFELGPDDMLRVRVLTRGSGGLYGLLAKPGEAARTLEDMEEAIDRSVRARGPVKR